MADSDKVQVGDVALAIGNPFGVGQTVTQGIVSATDRGNVGIEAYENFIQTDAAINPGNSGGALVDIEGRLIGINTAILSRSGGSQGVGFAIPSNIARTVMDSLIAHGHVTRVIWEDDSKIPRFRRSSNSRSNGALIGDVRMTSAAKAGFKPGDVVLEFAAPVTGQPASATRKPTKPALKCRRDFRTAKETLDHHQGAGQKVAETNTGMPTTSARSMAGVSDLDPPMSSTSRRMSKAQSLPRLSPAPLLRKPA
jgi:hypothetical protein